MAVIHLNSLMLRGVWRVGAKNTARVHMAKQVGGQPPAILSYPRLMSHGFPCAERPRFALRIDRDSREDERAGRSGSEGNFLGCRRLARCAGRRVQLRTTPRVVPGRARILAFPDGKRWRLLRATLPEKCVATQSAGGMPTTPTRGKV